MENMMTPADVAAVTRANEGDGYGWGGGGFMWIFALLLLPLLTGGGAWGNRGNAVTEADLCNANSFSELKGSVGRLSDQVGSMYTGLQNGICNLGYELQSLLNTLASQIATCCCEIKSAIDGVRFDMANYNAQTNATTVATGQKILDKLCQMELNQKDVQISGMAQRIQQLELNNALCGVVRYPTSWTYDAGTNPFCGGGGYRQCRDF
ncbi:MAG: hypothetical protein IJ418_02205 [Clostridia bacterium]|nr:hypothetical protein [Clostridia bacterium]MBQ8616304.1 hypothetical protein [Clostridia bacterium]